MHRRHRMGDCGPRGGFGFPAGLFAMGVGRAAVGAAVGAAIGVRTGAAAAVAGTGAGCSMRASFASSS